MLALFERTVGDLAQQAGAVVQGAHIGSVDLVGVGLETVVDEGCQAGQHRVDPHFSGHECIESFGVVSGEAGGHGVVNRDELHRFGLITIVPAGG